MPVNARYWILTIPFATPAGAPTFDPSPTGPVAEGVPVGIRDDAVIYAKGQQELSATGFHHWQLVVGFSRAFRLAGVRALFGPYHAETTRSDAADDYVWKDDTAVADTRFLYGAKPIKRNSAADWQQVWDLAVAGRIDEVDAGIRVGHYRTLMAIAKDHAVPVVRAPPTVRLYWGVTGSGKSHRANAEAYADVGLADVYTKTQTMKWWDGYQGQKRVVVDEYRGDINIGHMLRWLDKWPVSVEIKGGSVPLCATEWWFTSNLSLEDWYPTLDAATQAALRRRFTTIVHFPLAYGQLPQAP